jgi:hypothetical protein
METMLPYHRVITPVGMMSRTNAVVARAVVLLPNDCVVPIVPVGRVGVPVNVGDAKSAFVATATAMFTNSVLISVPLTIFSGSPEVSASFVAKFVD